MPSNQSDNPSGAPADNNGSAADAAGSAAQTAESSPDANEQRELLHRLRQELDQQRQSSAELRALVENKLAGMNPQAGGADPELVDRLVNLETSVAGMGSDSRVDAAMLRITELERKTGEQTSDPLINEMAHRISALESNNAAPRAGADLVQVKSSLNQLQAEVRTRGVAEGRVDDVVLRIASLEGSLKKPTEDHRVDELQQEISALKQKEQQLREDPRWGELKERLDALQGDAAREQEQKFEQLTARLETLDARTAQPPADPRLDAFLTRLDSLEEQTKQPAADPRVDAVSERLGKLEEQTKQPAADPRVDAVNERLGSLEGQVSQGVSGVRVEELENRLGVVEQNSSNTELESQLTDLKQQSEALRARIAEGESDPRLDGALTRVAELERKAAEPAPADPRIGDAMARLATVEAGLGQKSSAGDIEGLTKRLADLETQANSGPSPELEKLASRVSDVELDFGNLPSNPFVAAMAERVNKLEDAAGDESRLEQLSQKVTALESRPASDPAAAENGSKIAELATRLRAVEGKTSSPRSPEDPRVDPLLERITVLESKPAETAETDRRVEGMETRLSQLELRPADAAEEAELAELRNRLSAVEQRPQGGVGEDPRVEALAARLAEVEGEQAHGGGADPDPRVDDLMARMGAVEQRPASEGEGAGVPAELSARIETLEGELKAAAEKLQTLESRGAASGDGSGGDPARLESLEHKLSQLEQSDSAVGVKAQLEQESSRWSNWARQTGDQLKEVRRQVQKIKDRKGDDDAAKQDLVESISKSIGQGLSHSLGNDIKSIKMQMYIIFFLIGLIVAFMAVTSLA